MGRKKNQNRHENFTLPLFLPMFHLQSLLHKPHHLLSRSCQKLCQLSPLKKEGKKTQTHRSLRSQTNIQCLYARGKEVAVHTVRKKVHEFPIRASHLPDIQSNDTNIFVAVDTEVWPVIWIVDLRMRPNPSIIWVINLSRFPFPLGKNACSE